MGVFRVQVHYRKGTAQKWSNVWHCSSDNLPVTAITFEDEGVPRLLNVLSTGCQIHSLLVSDTASDDFTIIPIGLPGLNAGEGQLLPLFNCARVLFDQGFGRPDYKFMKGYLAENMVNEDLIADTQKDWLHTQIAAMITAMDGGGAPLVSAGGVTYTTCVVQAEVQMRQMHRKRKKSEPSSARARA